MSQITELQNEWNTNKRWAGIKRDYSAAEVIRLRPRIPLAYTLATLGSETFFKLLQQKQFYTGFGALTGNQALAQAHCQQPFIYVSGWQIAADNNSAGKMYPDLSLYPVDSGPNLVRTINHTLMAADKIAALAEPESAVLVKPIMIDAEAGFGGPLNAFELTKQLIEAGVAALHIEDQLPSAKRCGHLAGKVIVGTTEMLNKLKAARLSADVCNVPTVLIARTDAYGAKFINTDIDEVDRPFVTQTRSPEGLYGVNGKMEHAIARSLCFAPYVDMLWCETGKPDLKEAEQFATAIHAKFPGKPLVYNCSPSFHWQKYLNDKEIASFQQALFEMGYHIQLITLAGFHALHLSMFEMINGYRKKGLQHYANFQAEEFKQAEQGYRAHKHQALVGTAFYDAVLENIMQDDSLAALPNSTEADF